MADITTIPEWRIGEVYLPDPAVFRELAPNDEHLLRPTGPIHALLEVSLDGEPSEVVERVTDPERLTACGQMVGDLGEGCGPTRLRYMRMPSVVDDGHIVGTTVTCPGCLGAMTEQTARQASEADQ